MFPTSEFDLPKEVSFAFHAHPFQVSAVQPFSLLCRSSLFLSTFDRVFQQMDYSNIYSSDSSESKKSTLSSCSVSKSSSALKCSPFRFESFITSGLN